MNIDDEISYAAARLGATAWSPAQWGDRNSDAYALTMPGLAGVVMINTDLVDEGNVTAHAYRTDGVPSVAGDIMPALMRDDGASIDPIGEVTVDVAYGDTVGALRAAATDAFARILQDMIGSNGIAVVWQLVSDTYPTTEVEAAPATDTENIDQAVLDLFPVGVHVPFHTVEERARDAGLDLRGRPLHEVLMGLVTGGGLTLTYGRGYQRRSPYDTGEILEPKVWTTNGRFERHGRVDFENDEGATDVTVWVERGPDGPIVHVIDHTDAVTVSQE